MTDDAPKDELWKKHEFLNGLYRFYLEQIIDFHKFYLPIVGAVVVYVLANPTEAVAFGLAIPLIASLGAVFIFGVGVGEARQLNQAIARSADELGILTTHARMLVRATTAFLLMHIVIAVGMVLLIGELNHQWNLPGIKSPDITKSRPSPLA